MKGVGGKKRLIEVDDQRNGELMVKRDLAFAGRVVEVWLGLHKHVAQRLARAIEWISSRNFPFGLAFDLFVS